jgi:hypothetical protein
MKPFPPTHYVKPCEFRTEQGDKAYCNKISEASNFVCQINTSTCGQCRMTDVPNDHVILNRMLKHFVEICEFIKMGYYDEETILDVLPRFYDAIEKLKPTGDANKQVELFVAKLSTTVEICHAKNLADYNKMEILIRDRMPKLVSYVEKSQSNDVECKTCDKSFGVLGYAYAKLSGQAPEETQKARMSACEHCQLTDTKGERLYRVIDGAAYCGLPRKKKYYRNEKADGCGCDLADKTKYRKSKCPKSVWGYVD